MGITNTVVEIKNKRLEESNKKMKILKVSGSRKRGVDHRDGQDPSLLPPAAGQCGRHSHDAETRQLDD